MVLCNIDKSNISLIIGCFGLAPLIPLLAYITYLHQQHLMTWHYFITISWIGITGLIALLVSAVGVYISMYYLQLEKKRVVNNKP